MLKLMVSLILSKKDRNSNFNMKYFSGIGSRETPSEIQRLMTYITEYLYEKYYILRSGGANGADKAFEKGVPKGSDKEIYLPWIRFNGNQSILYDVGPEVMDLAAKFHPAWTQLSRHAKRLIARNGYQVLGKNLETPSKFVVCWTPGGKLTGGTAQAIRIAIYYKIPIFNLGKQKDNKHIKECLKTDQIFIKE